jgi:hypothetical protein
MCLINLAHALTHDISGVRGNARADGGINSARPIRLQVPERRH